VPTAHLADASMSDTDWSISPEQIFQRDCRWVSECDALVAEASTPSHGVGYEVALALSLRKPVLCCFRKGMRVSKMLTGNVSPGFHLLAYSTEEELRDGLLTFLNLI
jgi:nucleoside 2-deoxyribosyltransferase